MSYFTLYNTLTNKQESFQPREPGSVKLFTCGPSVYRRQHLGDYRTHLYEDVLHRYLRYLGFEVERVINFTDVEDKAIGLAWRKGISLAELCRPVVVAWRGVARKRKQDVQIEGECRLHTRSIEPGIPAAADPFFSAVRAVSG
ncbi:MAG: hypothetical protein ACODAD_13690 [Planctomycetota bacterium]